MDAAFLFKSSYHQRFILMGIILYIAFLAFTRLSEATDSQVNGMELETESIPNHYDFNTDQIAVAGKITSKEAQQKANTATLHANDVFIRLFGSPFSIENSKANSLFINEPPSNTYRHREDYLNLMPILAHEIPQGMESKMRMLQPHYPRKNSLSNAEAFGGNALSDANALAGNALSNAASYSGNAFSNAATRDGNSFANAATYYGRAVSNSVSTNGNAASNARSFYGDALSKASSGAPGSNLLHVRRSLPHTYHDEHHYSAPQYDYYGQNSIHIEAPFNKNAIGFYPSHDSDGRSYYGGAQSGASSGPSSSSLNERRTTQPHGFGNEYSHFEPRNDSYGRNAISNAESLDGNAIGFSESYDGNALSTAKATGMGNAFSFSRTY